jgi:hypothetical protein
MLGLRCQDKPLDLVSSRNCHLERSESLAERSRETLCSSSSAENQSISAASPHKSAPFENQTHGSEGPGT